MLPSQLQIDATLEALEDVVPVLRDTAAGLLPEGRLDRFEIALVEALTNIIRHAYAGRNDGRIDIGITMEQRTLTVVLRDNGIAADPAHFKAAEPKDVGDAIDDLPESGWGLDLIRQCSDGMTYRRLASGNELTLLFRP
jgi:serine/threonine-protein kinase RsbW